MSEDALAEWMEIVQRYTDPETSEEDRRSLETIYTRTLLVGSVRMLEILKTGLEALMAFVDN